MEGRERRRGRGRGHTSRIQCVDVDTQIHGVLGADSVSDLLDYPGRADGVDLARFGDLEAAVAVVVVVRQAGQRGADAGVDVAVVG